MSTSKDLEGSIPNSQLPFITATRDVIYGGTGQSTYDDGELLIGNSITHSLNKTTLIGTTNQINIINGHGTITLTAPQDLDTFANVTFNNMNLTTGQITNAPILANDIVNKTYADTFIPVLEKGEINGVCPLNNIGLIDTKYLDPSVFTYEGTWDASTNTPFLVDGIGGINGVGSMYICSVEGTQFNPPITFLSGDFVVYSDSKWEKINSGLSIKSINNGTNINVTQNTGVYTISTIDQPSFTNVTLNEQTNNAHAVRKDYVDSADTKLQNQINNKIDTAINIGLNGSIGIYKDTLEIGPIIPDESKSLELRLKSVQAGQNTGIILDNTTDPDTIIINSSCIQTIANDDGKITIIPSNLLLNTYTSTNANPNINLLNYFRWGNGSYRGLLYQFNNPNISNGAQIAFNATLTASITSCVIGFQPVNRGYDTDMESSVKELWTFIKDNLPMKIRLSDPLIDGSYFTLSLNSFGGIGVYGYSFVCANVLAETTMINLVANGSFLYVLFDYTNKTYIDSQDTIIQGNLTTHINNLIGAHTALAISTTGTGTIATSINAQNNINELDTALNTHITKITGAHEATAISTNINGHYINNTNVQSNLSLLDNQVFTNTTNITTLQNNKIDTLTNTDTNLSITGTGTSRNINVNLISATKGGTGINTYAIGDLITANTTTTMSKLPDVAIGNALISGGVGVVPSYGKIQLASGANQHINGILPVANGGTGNSTLTSNGVLIGNLTNPITSSKLAPSGDFIGTTDLQTLTNKTINGLNNTITNIAGSNVTTNQTLNYITASDVQNNLDQLDTQVFANTTNLSNHIASTTAHTDVNLVNTAGTRTYGIGSNIKLALDGLDTECVSLQTNKIDTVANIGTGTGTIFSNKTGTTANLKTLKIGTGGLSLTNNASDITINSSSITSITNTDTDITVDLTNPLIPDINLHPNVRYGIGSHRAIYYQHNSPSIANSTQIGFTTSSSTLVANIISVDMGNAPINRGYESALTSSYNALLNFIKDNLPMKVRFVDPLNDTSYFTLILNSTGASTYGVSFNTSVIGTETTATNINTNGTYYYALLDYSSKYYIDQQINAIQQQQLQYAWLYFQNYSTPYILNVNHTAGIFTISPTYTSGTLGSPAQFFINADQLVYGGTGSVPVKIVATISIATTASNLCDIAVELLKNGAYLSNSTQYVTLVNTIGYKNVCIECIDVSASLNNGYSLSAYISSVGGDSSVTLSITSVKFSITKLTMG